MDSRLPKRVTKTAAGVTLVAGLVVALGAGAAQAGGPGAGTGSTVDRNSDRVILRSTVGANAAPRATVALSSAAPRVAGGAAVRVGATYSCPTGFQGYLDVLVDEVTNGHVSHAEGSNPAALNCNGATHTMTVTVVVDNDWPLTRGTAFGRAVLDVTKGDAEATAATQRTITVS